MTWSAASKDPAATGAGLAVGACGLHLMINVCVYVHVCSMGGGLGIPGAVGIKNPGEGVPLCVLTDGLHVYACMLTSSQVCVGGGAPLSPGLQQARTLQLQVRGGCGC